MIVLPPARTPTLAVPEAVDFRVILLPVFNFDVPFPNVSDPVIFKVSPAVLETERPVPPLVTITVFNHFVFKLSSGNRL